MEIGVGGAIITIPEGASDAAIKQAIETFRKSPEFERLIDKQTGAPANVRAIVGGSPEQDRLANVRRFFPDAVPFDENNFVFSDPTTGKPTLYNPKGFDVGDVASIGREASEAVGAGLGAVAGASSGLLTGPGAPLAVPTAGAVGAGLGGAAGGSLFDVSMSLLAGRIDTRSPVKSLIDTSIALGANALGQRGGELAEQGVKRALGGGTAAAKRMVDLFKSLRINPTAATATGSRALATVESTLDATPGSANIMQRAAEEVLEQTARAANEVAESFGQVQTQQGAGATIRSASVAAAERFRFTQEKAYQKAFDLVGGDTPVALSAVTALRERLQAELAKAPASLAKSRKPAIAILKRIEKDVEAGLPFDAFRQIRTDIGRNIDQVLIGSTGSMNEQLKLVYGALTADMSAVAREAGPDAAKSLAVADRFTRLFMNTAANTLKKIDKFDADEKAFKFALSASQDGGTTLSRLRRNFTPEEWDTVAGTVLGRLGLAKAGAQDASGELFSVNTFLTNWSKLAPEAKTALFGGKRYKGLARDLDNLVEAVGSLKGVEKMTNSSNTARNMIAFTTLSTFGGALGGLASGDVAGIGTGVAATIVAPRVAAKLITSPSFIKWLTTPVTSPNGVGAHIGRLVAIGKAEPELRLEIDQFAQALRPADPAATTQGERPSSQ